TRYLLVPLLLRLDRRRGGAAVSRRALAVPALRLSLRAEVGKELIAQPLLAGRPSAGAPPEMRSLPLARRPCRDALDPRARDLRRRQKCLERHHHDHRQACEAMYGGGCEASSD